MRNLGRFLFGLAYAVVPIIGWYMLYKSIKRVRANEISIVHDLSGNAELIEQGIYFRPFPGERFGATYDKTTNFIDFGPLKRIRVNAGQIGYKTDANGQLVPLQPGINIVHSAQNEIFDPVNGIKSNQDNLIDFGAKKIVRIRDGYLGVKTNNEGHYVVLQPGVHEIDTASGETFDPVNGIKSINQEDFTLGNMRYITIRNGELGESYHNGTLVVLEPGAHTLPPEHRFVKKVALNSDVVDLGALKIVTVKEGQVAVINTPDGVIVKGPGRHDINQTEGNYFNDIITTSPQGVQLPSLVVMCSDQIEMRAEAVMLYRVEDPLKTVGSGIISIVETLKRVADGTLRTILSRFSSADIAPSLHPDDEHHSSIRSEKLKQMHDECVQSLDNQAKEWGLRVTDLQITEILPADREYLAMIRNLASQQITADGNRRLAENEAMIAKITAEAGQSRLTAAEIAQKEAIIQAETKAKTKEIKANAQSMQITTKAAADAKAIELVSSAQANRMNQLRTVAEGANPVVHQVMLNESQAEILKQIPNPVFVQPGLGDTSVLTKKDNGLTLFSTKRGPSPLVDALTLHQTSGQLFMQNS